ENKRIHSAKTSRSRRIWSSLQSHSYPIEPRSHSKTSLHPKILKAQTSLHRQTSCSNSLRPEPSQILLLIHDARRFRSCNGICPGTRPDARYSSNQSFRRKTYSSHNRTTSSSNRAFAFSGL